MNSKATAIKNVNILTMNQNKDIIENGMVIYKDDKIIYVGCEKEFDEDDAKTLARLARDTHSFLMQHYDYFSAFDLINVYYDKGQQVVYKALAQAFGISGYPAEFKKEAKQEKYRLAQVADYITSIRLTELKMNAGTLSKSEERFFENKKVFKRVYLRSLNKKNFK